MTFEPVVQVTVPGLTFLVARINFLIAAAVSGLFGVDASRTLVPFSGPKGWSVTPLLSALATGVAGVTRFRPRCAHRLLAPGVGVLRAHAPGPDLRVADIAGGDAFGGPTADGSGWERDPALQTGGVRLPTTSELKRLVRVGGSSGRRASGEHGHRPGTTRSRRRFGRWEPGLLFLGFLPY
mgnify:CR=1 FL=1